MTSDIFISYRRKGAITEAVVLYYNLKARGYRVFLDFTSLHSGKFSDEIRQEISGCTYFLLLINPTAFNRCNEENDCFRKEIEWALENNKLIVPILVNQKDFPTNIPEHLLKIKDFNFVPGLPLQFADEMVTRLINHYMTELQPEAVSVQLEYTEPTPEMDPEEEKILKWASITEDQWKTCAICGTDDVEIEDEEGNFQNDLEDFGQCMHYFALFQVLLFPLVGIVYGLCQIPSVHDWVILFLQENLKSVYDLITSEVLPQDTKAAIGVVLMFPVSGVTIFTRNMIREYARIISSRVDEDYYKAKCCCNRCKSVVYTEIPTWNLLKIQEEKESNQTFNKISSFLAAAILFLFSVPLSEFLRFALHPTITFLAWPLLVILGCAVFLIWLTFKYQKLKNQ